MEPDPVAPAPAKHATNWVQCKQAEKAINWAQLGLFEFE
jgi:hypothetical protein